MKRHTRLPVSVLVLAFATTVLLGGCERSKEDLEAWRNAKRGMEKMQTWAASPDEPMEVRIRALEIMVEQYNPSTASETLKKVDNQGDRAKLEKGIVDKVEAMWKTGDYPTVDKLRKEMGVDTGADQLNFEIPLPGPGQVQSFYKGVKAKDAAFHLVQSVQQKKQKERLQSILADWLSKEWRLRNQVGKVTLAQIVPYAGPEGEKHAMKWLKQTNNFSTVSRALIDNGDDKLRGKVTDVLVERAREQAPEVSDKLAASIIKAEHPNAVSFLEEAVREGYFSPTLLDGSMDAIRKIEGPKSTDFFVGLIESRTGPLRWAAVNDLILARGKSGVLSAAFSLPLDAESYADTDEGRFQNDANWFGNFVASEAKNWDGDLHSTVTRLLESERWPARVLGLAVVQSAELTDLKSKVESMSDDSQTIPGWKKQKTIGALAGDVANALDS